MSNLPELRATFDDSFAKNAITASNYISLVVFFGSSYNRYSNIMTFASGQKSTKGVLSLLKKIKNKKLRSSSILPQN
jgi:hypothetical protein